MKGPAADAPAARTADDDRHAGAVAVPARRREVRQHVEAARDEVDELDLADGTEAPVRRADSRPGEPLLGNRRVDHARLAEALLQTLGHLERAAVSADVFAHDEHAF